MYLLIVGITLKGTESFVKKNHPKLKPLHLMKVFKPETL